MTDLQPPTAPPTEPPTEPLTQPGVRLILAGMQGPLPAAVQAVTGPLPRAGSAAALAALDAGGPGPVSGPLTLLMGPADLWLAELMIAGAAPAAALTAWAAEVTAILAWARGPAGVTLIRGEDLWAAPDRLAPLLPPPPAAPSATTPTADPPAPALARMAAALAGLILATDPGARACLATLAARCQRPGSAGPTPPDTDPLDPDLAGLDRAWTQLTTQETARQTAHAAALQQATQAAQAADRHIAALQADLAGAQAGLAAVTAGASQAAQAADRRSAALQADLAGAQAGLVRQATALGDGQARLAAAMATQTRLQDRLTRLQTDLAGLRRDLATRDAGLAALRASTSWRVTAPLRRLTLLFRRG